MYIQTPLRQILSALSGSFHSIDIRSATKKHDSGWLSLLTAVRISARPIGEIQLRHQKLIDESPTIQAGQFRVFFQALPFSDIGLASASLNVEGERIVLQEAITIDQGRSQISRWKNFVLPWSQETWSNATYSFGTRSTSFQEPDIAGAAIQNGWPSVESAVSALLEVEKEDLYRLSISIFINIEMPAQIQLVSVGDKSFAINVKAERNIKSLALYWNEKSATGETNKKLALDKVGDENGFTLWRTQQIQVSADAEDELSCWLSHEPLPVIDFLTGHFKDFLPFPADDQSTRANPAQDRAKGIPHKKQVFISHINEEAQLAVDLKKWVEESFSSRCDVFVSSHPKDLPAGTKWLEEISRALENASILIVLCSAGSIIRPWINFEAGCCWNRRIPIVPICHSGQQRSDLPPPLSSFQALELEDGKFSDHLIHALGSHLAIKPKSDIDYQHINSELVKTALTAKNDASKQRSLRPQLKDSALELVRSLERQESRKQTEQMLKQRRPSPLKIEFDGENSAEWIERSHPALPMQRVQHKVYGVVIYNSANHDVDNVTIELERIEDLTDQPLGKTRDIPYLGHKFSFERNGKTAMKFSPDLRDRVRLISHGNGIMMTNSFHIEGTENYFFDVKHHHRIHLKVTGDGVKPSKASFIVKLDNDGIFLMVRDENAALS